MALQEADDSEPEDEEENQRLSETVGSVTTFPSKHKDIRSREKRNTKWIGKVIKNDRQRKYYRYSSMEILCNSFIFSELYIYEHLQLRQF